MDDKTSRILDAAGMLFLKHGLRGTAMEAIARSAGIAKPTLYAYFPDKQAVFSALAETHVAQWRSAFLAGLRTEGDLPARIAAGLTAKAKAVMRAREGSPHADELYAPLLRAFEAEIADTIERELAIAGVMRARLLARLLLAAVSGIVRAAQSVAELGPAIRLLTERLIEPELPRHVRA